MSMGACMLVSMGACMCLCHWVHAWVLMSVCLSLPATSSVDLCDLFVLCDLHGLKKCT